MKKLSVTLITCFAFLCLAGTSFAQQKDSVKTLTPITVTATSNVTQKVDEAFKKEFKDAVNPQWYKLDKNYLAKFISNDMKNSALFTKKGSLIYHISYGTERNLPEEVKTMVTNSYPDYNISGAINVKQADRNIWVVNLSGLKKMVVVRAEGGELEEVQQLTKAL